MPAKKITDSQAREIIYAQAKKIAQEKNSPIRGISMHSCRKCGETAFFTPTYIDEPEWNYSGVDPCRKCGGKNWLINYIDVTIGDDAFRIVPQPKQDKQ